MLNLFSSFNTNIEKLILLSAIVNLHHLQIANVISRKKKRNAISKIVISYWGINDFPHSWYFLCTYMKTARDDDTLEIYLNIFCWKIYFCLFVSFVNYFILMHLPILQPPQSLYIYIINITITTISCKAGNLLLQHPVILCQGYTQRNNVERGTVDLELHAHR